MKKQLLIAAVAATMASATFADVSISGAAQMNINTVGSANTTYSTDIDLKVTGKAGDTTAVIDMESTGTDGVTSGTLNHGMKIKNSYVKTSVAGANIKVGNWYGSDSLLGNGSNDDTAQISIDYTMNGVKLQWEDQAGSDSVTISGTVAGVALSHEIFSTKTDTKVSADVAGVSITYRSVDNDVDASDMSSLELSTTVSGVKLAYATVDANASHSSDAFFGDTTFTDATGVSATMALAGNNVTVKSFDKDDVDTMKYIINRPMAGGTFEATFTDTDGSDSIVDLELAVKF
jgi:hypothetical protein